MALCVYKMLDRRLEKTKLNAYMVYIRYDGSNYVCFDELKDQKTVKGYFKDLLKKKILMCTREYNKQVERIKTLVLMKIYCIL